jgi:diacylglycerol kinase (ATP)
MRALLVHNPSAGSGQPDSEELLRLLDEAGFSARYVRLPSEALEDALERGDMDIVVVAGGDGTVATVARRLHDRSIPLALVPTGDVNNVARCLDVVDGTDAITKALQDAPCKQLDIGCVTGPWGRLNFLESVGWGALAEVVDIGVRHGTPEEKIVRGRELFAEILETAVPGHIRLDIDGRCVEGDFVFVEILNIGITGPRITISPSAKPGDGLLDIVCLPAAHRQEMIDWLRFHADDAPIPLNEVKAKMAKLCWRHGPLRVDDRVFDPPATEAEVFVTIEPKGLQVRVPPRD